MARSITGDDPTATAVYVDVDGDTHFNGSNVFVEAGTTLLSLGTPTICTIASGVLTATGSHIAAAAESGTTDTVDSIALTGRTAAAGDLLIIVPDTGDTITFDDANIDLGAATREVAPGGCIILRYDGASWGELVFLAAADNS